MPSTPTPAFRLITRPRTTLQRRLYSVFLTLGFSALCQARAQTNVVYQEAFTHGPGVWSAFSGDTGVQREFGVQAADPARGQTLAVTFSVAEGVPYWYGGLTGDIQADFPAANLAELAGLMIEFDLWSSQGAPGGIELWAKDPRTGGTLKTSVSAPAGQWTRVSVPFASFANHGFTFPRGMWELGLNLNPTQNLGVGWVFEVQLDNIRIYKTDTYFRFTSPGRARARLGLPFTHALATSGAATGYTATGLPEGLTLHPETGVISGAPIRVGEHAVQVAATHALGATRADLLITVETDGTEVVYRQDFIGGSAEWFAYAGDTGVTHSLVTTRDGPLGLAALTLTTQVRSATYWYAGAGMASVEPFPARTPAEARRLALRFDLRSSARLAKGFTVGIKPRGSSAPGLLHIFDAPGAEWTSISIPFEAFDPAQLAGFDYTTRHWEILIAPAQTPLWGYEGDFSFSIARFAVFREAAR